MTVVAVVIRYDITVTGNKSPGRNTNWNGNQTPRAFGWGLNLTEKATPRDKNPSLNPRHMQVPVHMSCCWNHPHLFRALHGFILRSIDFCCSQVALYSSLHRVFTV